MPSSLWNSFLALIWKYLPVVHFLQILSLSLSISSFLALWEAWELGLRSKDTDINFFYQQMPKAEEKAFFFFGLYGAKNNNNNILFISWDFESYRINSNGSLMTF